MNAAPSPAEAMVGYHAPTSPEAPVVFDAPHAGRHYPADFGAAVAQQVLEGGEDRFVDELLLGAPAHGAHLVIARFARTYIDPNRSVDDIDPALLDNPWPQPLDASANANMGTALVFRVIGDAVPIYDRKLSVKEVEARIRCCYAPYHERLQRTLDEVQARHGQVWYIDWHSMTSVGTRLSPNLGRPRADFVLGDRDGSTCAPGFTRFVADTLRDLGHTVAINDPYKGAELVARHGEPQRGRHALQVEMRRGLYMDEKSLEKHSGYARLKADLDSVSRKVCAFAREAA